MTWRNWCLAVFGAWFVVSPWVVGPTSQVYIWSAVVLGGLTLLGAAWGLLSGRTHAWAMYLTALFGLYLGLTPYFYGFTSRAGSLWLSMLVGAAILAASLWQAVGPHTPETEHSKAA